MVEVQELKVRRELRWHHKCGPNSLLSTHLCTSQISNRHHESVAIWNTTLQYKAVQYRYIEINTPLVVKPPRDTAVLLVRIQR